MKALVQNYSAEVLKLSKIVRRFPQHVYELEFLRARRPQLHWGQKLHNTKPTFQRIHRQTRVAKSDMSVQTSSYKITCSQCLL